MTTVAVLITSTMAMRMNTRCDIRGSINRAKALPTITDGHRIADTARVCNVRDPAKVRDAMANTWRTKKNMPRQARNVCRFQPWLIISSTTGGPDMVVLVESNPLRNPVTPDAIRSLRIGTVIPRSIRTATVSAIPATARRSVSEGATSKT